MLTLHAATEDAKALAKIAIVLVVLVIIIVLLMPFFNAFLNSLFPKQVALPEARFGKVPHISFPENSLQKNFTYTINTLPGDLPTFPDRVNVYQIPAPQPNLLALERAKQRVADVGFFSQPTPITDTLYQWIETSVLSKKLEFDILSLNFGLDSTYLTPEASMSAGSLPLDTKATEMTTNFITKLSSFPGDIDQGKTKITYYIIADGKLKEIPTRESAQILRVSFFQNNLAELPIYYPNPPFSTMNLLVGGGEQFSPTVIGGLFTHYTPDSSSTYAIKTSQQAFDDLKNKRGYIASHNGSSNNIVITDVKLGYYAPYVSQGYLLPIIVFEGEEGFLGYVEAIADNWLTYTEN